MGKRLKSSGSEIYCLSGGLFRRVVESIADTSLTPFKAHIGMVLVLAGMVKRRGRLG